MLSLPAGLRAVFFFFHNYLLSGCTMEVRGQPGRWDIAWQARGRGQEVAPQVLASPILGIASQLRPHSTGTPVTAESPLPS